VLDFSKIESGQLILDKVPFSMRDITENVQGIFSAMALEKGLAFQVLVDPGFPARLTGDPVRVGQILNNFVSNAIKYTEHGSVTVDVRAISRTANRVTAKITVIDTGKGLSEDQQGAHCRAGRRCGGARSCHLPASGDQYGRQHRRGK
jgi:signal transduction histidine kinase